MNHSYGYYRGVLRGVGRYSETKPNWLLTSIIPERPKDPFRRTPPNGLIASLNTRSTVRALANWRKPLVNVSAVYSELRYPRVGVDNARIGQIATEHFLERGLRNFGFVGPQKQQFSSERRAAFIRAVQEAGFKVAIYHSRCLNVDPTNRRWDLDRGVCRWIRELPKPCGVFVPSDAWGVQLAEACRTIDVHIPDEIAILGVDDDDLDCELTRPRLSSVIVPSEKIGFEAAALLDRLLAGKSPPRQPILFAPPGIATRKSTDILALDDRAVVTAIRYVRDNAHLPLRVSDFLQEVPVGRRALERRCQRSLGWGLGAEIRRAHLERAQSLLARTELPIKSIALQAGFTSFRHMSVVFRQELDMSPTKYRNLHREPAAK